MQVIEIIGFPGCGKTTLLENSTSIGDVKKINTDLFYSEAKRENGFVKALRIVKYILCNVRFSFALLSLVFEVDRSIKNNLVIFLQFIRHLLIFDESIIANKDESVLLYDQAIYQNLWALFLGKRKIDSSLRSKLVRLIKMIDKKYNIIVMYLQVDGDVAAMQAHRRNSSSPMDRVDLPKLQRIYKDHELDYQVLRDTLAADKFYIVDDIASYETYIDRIRA